MTRAVKELYEKAATLPPEERAELAELLLGTIPAEQHGRGNGSGPAPRWSKYSTSRHSKTSISNRRAIAAAFAA